jgi:hypothetical protein
VTLTLGATSSLGESDSTRTVRDTVRGSKQQLKAGIGGAIRRLFRQAVKVLTGRETDVPMPKKSGRRTGDNTARRFTRTAHRLTRLRVRAAAALPWLVDTLDWLNLWQPGGADLTDDLSQDSPKNHLSPRL